MAIGVNLIGGKKRANAVGEYSRPTPSYRLLPSVGELRTGVKYRMAHGYDEALGRLNPAAEHSIGRAYLYRHIPEAVLRSGLRIELHAGDVEHSRALIGERDPRNVITDVTPKESRFKERILLVENPSGEKYYAVSNIHGRDRLLHYEHVLFFGGAAAEHVSRTVFDIDYVGRYREQLKPLPRADVLIIGPRKKFTDIFVKRAKVCAQFLGFLNFFGRPKTAEELIARIKANYQQKIDEYLDRCSDDRRPQVAVAVEEAQKTLEAELYPNIRALFADPKTRILFDNAEHVFYTAALVETAEKFMNAWTRLETMYNALGALYRPAKFADPAVQEFKTKDFQVNFLEVSSGGRTVRIALAEIQWGDLSADLTEAFVEKGVSGVYFSGSAGSLGKSVERQWLALPKNGHNRALTDLELYNLRAAGVDVVYPRHLSGISTPLVETKSALEAMMRAGYHSVECESGRVQERIATLNAARADRPIEFHSVLYISDAPRKDPTQAIGNFNPGSKADDVATSLNLFLDQILRKIAPDILLTAKTSAFNMNNFELRALGLGEEDLVFFNALRERLHNPSLNPYDVLEYYLSALACRANYSVMIVKAFADQSLQGAELDFIFRTSLVAFILGGQSASFEEFLNEYLRRQRNNFIQFVAIYRKYGGFKNKPHELTPVVGVLAREEREKFDRFAQALAA